MMDIKVFLDSMSGHLIVLLITIILAAYNICEIRKADMSIKKIKEMKRLLDEVIARNEK